MMKNRFKKIVTLLAVLCLSFAFGQAKKPTIMVVPSDVWCSTNGYMTSYNNQGTVTKIPDLKKGISGKRCLGSGYR